MRKLYLFIFLFGSVLSAHGQKPLVEPYMLGLLDDYQGRKWVKEDPREATLVDKFHATEAILVTYLDSLISSQSRQSNSKTIINLAKWEKKECYFCHEFKRMYSSALAGKLNDYYSFKPSKEVDEKNQKVYTGTLKHV